jgi:hypothetical protein
MEIAPLLAAIGTIERLFVRRLRLGIGLLNAFRERS